MVDTKESLEAEIKALDEELALLERKGVLEAKKAEIKKRYKANSRTGRFLAGAGVMFGKLVDHAAAVEGAHKKQNEEKRERVVSVKKTSSVDSDEEFTLPSF